jgi:D-amino-acid oxidase
MLARRTLIRDSMAAAAGLVAVRSSALLGQTGFAAPDALEPVLARPDRIMRVSVCLRPFRATGPRIELERIGSKAVVHHYGHGGSGWSLCWGSAQEAIPLALSTGAKEIAILGAGVIGITSAITAQRMGAKVTIYTKERFPDVRSGRATGTWSPHSRIGMAGALDAGFAERWERMTRRTFAVHQSYLGLPGDPVEWIDRYALSDTPPEKRAHTPVALPGGGTDMFVDYEERVTDLMPGQETLAPGSYPFRAPFARKTTTLMYNVSDLFRHLERDFLLAGGRFVPMDVRGREDLAKIREKTIINCIGFAARQVFSDSSVIPVRGQLTWLLPQPGARYGLSYRQVSLLSRRDGIVVQRQGVDDSEGFNDSNETPDYAAAREAIATLAPLFA